MKNINNCYNQEYFEKRDILPRHLAETLALVLKKRGVKKVLDIGCGTGKLVNYLKQAGFDSVGCDRSPEAIRISRQVKASATKLPFKAQSFDAVIAISLIEHLSPQEAKKFIKETRRVLKPRGYFFLITPNLFSLLKLFRGSHWFAYRDPTHIKFYSLLSLRKLLKIHGFSKFSFRFKPSRKTPADWPFSVPSLPQTFHFLFNLAFIFSPLAYFRDSFWILCQKN